MKRNTQTPVLKRTVLYLRRKISVAILALLLTIWTRGRVKKTGILLSIGVGKAAILAKMS